MNVTDWDKWMKEHHIRFPSAEEMRKRVRAENLYSNEEGRLKGVGRNETDRQDEKGMETEEVRH